MKKPWACNSTAGWDSDPGQLTMPENPEVLPFQRPIPARGEDFHPTATHQEKGSQEEREN